MSLNRCIHHKERDATSVCDVCGRYFCEECVGERYYPKPGIICHECSGVKPAEPSSTPRATPQVAREQPKAASEQTPVPVAGSIVAPSIEIAVLVVCALFILGRVAYTLIPHEEVLELTSDTPEALAEFCISKLTIIEQRGAYPPLEDLKTACPTPIEVEATEFGHIVVSPDPDRFGFTEIELEREPFALMIME